MHPPATPEEPWPAPTGPPVDIGPAPRRARSVDPRRLLATQDHDTPNVGVPPEPARPGSGESTAAGGGGDAATAPAVVDTGDMDVPRPPRAGERACPVCAEPNAVTRRFCLACGTKLPAASPSEDPAGGPDDRRRGKRRPRTWRQRARAAGQGPLRYTEGFTTQAKARAVMLVLGGLAAVTALVAVGRERAMGVLGWQQEGTPPAGAELLTPQGDEADEVAGFAAANVHDDDRATGVAVVWEPDADGEPARIRLRLPEPTDVRTVRIAAGLADDADDAPLMLRPSRVRVCADSGGCQEIELSDSASLESYDVDLGDDVQTLELTVLAVRETGTTTYPLTVISEVRTVP